MIAITRDINQSWKKMSSAQELLGVRLTPRQHCWYQWLLAWKWNDYWSFCLNESCRIRQCRDQNLQVSHQKRQFWEDQEGWGSPRHCANWGWSGAADNCRSPTGLTAVTDMSLSRFLPIYKDPPPFDLPLFISPSNYHYAIYVSSCPSLVCIFFSFLKPVLWFQVCWLLLVTIT